MRFFSLIGLCLLAVPVLSSAEVSLRNDREGKTYYSSWSNKRAVKKALNEIDAAEILSAFTEIEKEAEPAKLCSFNINQSLIQKLQRVNPRFDELDGAILHLRNQNAIDDTATKILLEAHKATTAQVVLPEHDERLYYPKRQVLNDAIDLVAKFEERTKILCFDEAYKNLYGDILKLNKNLHTRHLRTIYYEAYSDRKISKELYYILERARLADVEMTSLTLKAYYKKVKSLRTQFPLPDDNEKSDFVTTQDDAVKLGRRQKLLESYSDIQIVLMADIVKKLKVRLDAPRAEILIYDRSNTTETIVLDPMERFRLAIKLLRKEMSLLALNTYFAGRTPSYMDVLVAAYEVGMIKATELEVISGLEELWNPKKTFAEKAIYWARMFSPVVTLAIPQPWGFVPALAIVIVEMTAGTKDNDSEDPTVLF